MEMPGHFSLPGAAGNCSYSPPLRIRAIRPRPDKRERGVSRIRPRAHAHQVSKCPPFRIFTTHIFSSMALLFCLTSPPLRRFNCDATRNNSSAGVSRYRLLMDPLFRHLYQLTSFLMKRMFLYQHRRGGNPGYPLPLRPCGRGFARSTYRER